LSVHNCCIVDDDVDLENARDIGKMGLRAVDNMLRGIWLAKISFYWKCLDSIFLFERFG
jgi:hypothetical protein